MVGAEDIHAAAAKGGAKALVADFKGAEHVNASDAGSLAHDFRDGRGDRRIDTGARGSFGAHVNIGAQLAVQPNLDGFTEAADHDSNADHHGNGGGEGGNDDGSTGQGGYETAAGYESFRAADLFKKTPQGADHPGDESRGDHGRRGDREQYSYVAENRAAVDGSELTENDGRDGSNCGDEKVAANMQPGAMLDCRAPHGFGGSDTRGFERRDEGGEDGNRSAGEKRDRDGSRGERNGAWCAGGKQGVHCIGDHADERRGEKTPERDACYGTGDAQNGGFAKKDEEHAPGTGSQRAKDADFGAPADHAYRDRVVNEKRAYQKRDVAEHSQIPAGMPAACVDSLHCVRRAFLPPRFSAPRI